MRTFFGIIIGGLLTVGGAYVADSIATSKDATAKPMVNWEVVGKNVEALTTLARDTWKRLTG